jgi:hypothetical protein
LLINARHTTELTFNPSGDRATHFHSSSGKNRPEADFPPSRNADIRTPAPQPKAAR